MKEDEKTTGEAAPPPVANPDPSVMAAQEAAMSPTPYPGGGAITQEPTPAPLEPWEPYTNAHQPDMGPTGGGVTYPDPGGGMVGVVPQGGFIGHPGGGMVVPEGGFTQVGGHHPGGMVVNTITTQQPIRSIPVTMEDVVMMTATPPPMVNPWSHEFCGCLEDTEVCCKACWCPCIVFGENAAALGHDCMSWGVGFFLSQFVGLSCLMGIQLRSEIREQRGIDGDTCNDCLVWWCLPLCALTQETMEIKKAQFSSDPGVNAMNRT